MRLFAILLGLYLLLPVSGAADPSGFLAQRQPLFTLGQSAGAGAPRASLFADRAEHGLFAPWPAARAVPLPAPLSRAGRTAARQIRDLIAHDLGRCLDINFPR